MASVLPTVSIDLSRRLMRVNVAYAETRMRVIEARTGQPAGPAYARDLGETECVKTPHQTLL